MTKRKDRTPIILRELGCVVFYNPTKQPDFPRGWYVREYHSDYAMEQHLKGKKGWERSYGDTGVFRTADEAREHALA